MPKFTAFGAYLGEVIIRNLGGKWRGADNPFDAAIVDLGQIKETYPVQKVWKRFENGMEDSLAHYYRGVEKYAKGG